MLFQAVSAGIFGTVFGFRLLRHRRNSRRKQGAVSGLRDSSKAGENPAEIVALRQSGVLPVEKPHTLAQDEDQSVNDSLEWLEAELRTMPIWESYPEIAEKSVQILRGWRERFPKKIWIRTVKKERILKELNESAPVIHRTLELIEQMQLVEGVKCEILDLCSGFGYLSMFLSELLPSEKVERLVLLDKCWPLHTQPEALPTQITKEHINLPGWPIPLITRKNDIKKGRQRRDVDEHVFQRAKGPVLILA
eukprot:gene26986-33189_t